MSEATVIPRTLATELLHAAQVAPANGVRGVVLADAAGRPSRYARDDGPGGRVWAAFLGGAPAHPAPALPAIDAALARAPRVLVAALDVRGVLRLELYLRADGGSARGEVAIVDGWADG